MTLWDFDRLRAEKPDLSRIEPLEGTLLGHDDLKALLAPALKSSRTSERSVMVVSGSSGAGKSALTSWVTSQAMPSSTSLDALAADVGGLTPDGDNVPALTSRLQAIQGGQPPRVLVFDDVDSQLLPDGVTRLCREMAGSIDFDLLLLTARTPIQSLRLPLAKSSHVLGNRGTNQQEFRDFVLRAFSSSWIDAPMPESGACESLHRLQEEAVDFRITQYVIEMLAARARETSKAPNALDLYHLVSEDPHIQQMRAFPGLQVADGRRLVFRAKDKTELLADTIMRLYESPHELALVASEELAGFDPDEFLADASGSYRDALMAVCLTRSPVEIVESLLGPRDLVREIEALQLDQSRLFDVPEARSRLLIRGLGFTLVETPRGVQGHLEHLDESDRLLLSGSATDEQINGTGLSVVHQVESLLLDLLHFWATYLYGSVRELVSRFNRHSNGKPVQTHRLTAGQVVGLLRYMDQQEPDVQQSLALRLVGRQRPLSDGVLKAADRCIELRNQFVHSTAGASGASVQIGREVADLIRAGRDLVHEASDSRSYPAVIKLVEIIFDEYGRRIFRAVNDEGSEIRIALAEESGDRLLVSEHYFMLPDRRVCVNPVLVPTSGASPRVLFEEAAEYDMSSGTQHTQGERLLRLASQHQATSILDVGSGNGLLTTELALSFPNARVLGIDVSEEMVKLASSRVDQELESRLRFESVGLLEFDPPEQYDLVFSNSSMHWVLPSAAAYGALYSALAPAGRLVVHQGGAGCYRGLWKCAIEVIHGMGLASSFANWTYPAFYPTKEEVYEMLFELGFCDISIDSVESDGSELMSLYDDFAYAGLLPFLHRVPETRQSAFREEFLRHAKATEPDKYSHRLYITAGRP